MRLGNLRENFSTLSEDEQRGFIASYRSQRARTMESARTKPKSIRVRTPKTTFESLGLTPEEAETAKSLGLTPAQVMKLRGA